MRVEFSDRFWADPSVLVAQGRSGASMGLYARGLSYMAEHGWDPDPGSSRCLAGIVVRSWLLHGGVPETRKPIRTLEQVGLWESVGAGGDGWWVLGRDVLWRFLSKREPIPEALRAAVAERDAGICKLCFEPIPTGETFHIDHKRPVIHGGRSVLENLQLAHATCNLKKGARV